MAFDRLNGDWPATAFWGVEGFVFKRVVYEGLGAFDVESMATRGRDCCGLDVVETDDACWVGAVRAW